MEVSKNVLVAKILNQMLDKYCKNYFPRGHHCLYSLRDYNTIISTNYHARKLYSYSNSCPLSRWCHPIISSSVAPFSSCVLSFPASGSFPMSQLFPPVGPSIGASALASVLPMNIQDWFPLGWTGFISLQSKGLYGAYVWVICRVLSSLSQNILEQGPEICIFSKCTQWTLWGP